MTDSPPICQPDERLPRDGSFVLSTVFEHGRTLIITETGHRYELLRLIDGVEITGGKILWRFLPQPADMEITGTTVTEILDQAVDRGFVRQAD